MNQKGVKLRQKYKRVKMSQFESSESKKGVKSSQNNATLVIQFKMSQNISYLAKP